jgi:hypothetical protein
MTSTAMRKTMTAVSMSETIAGYPSANLAAVEKIIADFLRSDKMKTELYP